MTVKEIFDLRKQGHIEEAYDAIRPMYAAHKGRYTSLCMFWTASDVFKLRLEQKRVEEAEKILEALKRMLPRVEEITKQQDNEKTEREQARLSVKTATPANIETRADDAKLPWEHNEKQSKGDSATRFIEYAEKRLASFASAATMPAGPPAGLSGSPASSVLSGSPAEMGSPAAATLPAGSLLGPALRSSPAALASSGSPAEPLNRGQQAVLDCIKANPCLKVPGLEAETGIPAKSIERHIKVLIERNLIEHLGSKKTGGYYAK